MIKITPMVFLKIHKMLWLNTAPSAKKVKKNDEKSEKKA